MENALIIITFVVGIVLAILLPQHEGGGWVLRIDPDLGRDFHPLEFN